MYYILQIMIPRAIKCSTYINITCDEISYAIKRKFTAKNYYCYGRKVRFYVECSQSRGRMSISSELGPTCASG